MSNSSIGPIYRTLSGATTQSESEPGSNGSEGVLRIHQSSSISGASVSDCLVSQPGHSLDRVSYPSVKLQSEYSTAQADWTICYQVFLSNTNNFYGSKESYRMLIIFKQIYLTPREDANLYLRYESDWTWE